MKRFTHILAVAGIISICVPAQAAFKGTLRSDAPITVEVTSSVSNAGSSAAAVYYLGRTLDVEAVFSVPVGTQHAQELANPGRRVQRVIIEVDLPVGGTGLAKVTQGAVTRFEFFLQNTTDDGSSRFVFDVVDF